MDKSNYMIVVAIHTKTMANHKAKVGHIITKHEFTKASKLNLSKLMIVTNL